MRSRNCGSPSWSASSTVLARSDQRNSIDQLALQLEELEANAPEDELAAESAVAKTTTVAGFTRRRPERNTFPEHLPRERVVIGRPTACDCCGGTRLRKLGEDVTRTLESIPRQWKVIETVREKFTCQDCEKISQAPAPFHVIPRGWAGRKSGGDDPVREVRPASTFEPAGRALRSGRGCRSACRPWPTP